MRIRAGTRERKRLTFADLKNGDVFQFMDRGHAYCLRLHSRRWVNLDVPGESISRPGDLDREVISYPDACLEPGAGTCER